MNNISGTNAGSPGQPDGTDLSETETPVQKLRRAARLTETAAYELAGYQPGELVAQLILMAAALERLSQAVEKSDAGDAVTG
ncbi:hypothetical protein [uncultured Roseobacter sp.]|uniref:hypothetical protein n=1 Tax=uncultured Roseobacter sp. TaxID=114847 RepID=UPI0026306442|nr:hypothetical protein [uncultured Roseobacter sp.]